MFATRWPTCSRHSHDHRVFSCVKGVAEDQHLVAPKSRLPHADGRLRNFHCVPYTPPRRSKRCQGLFSARPVPGVWAGPTPESSCSCPDPCAAAVVPASPVLGLCCSLSPRPAVPFSAELCWRPS
jgi:hypothetical protein